MVSAKLFFNDARLLTAQFSESNGRLPTDTEFSSMTMPMLNQPLSAPVELAVANAGATLLTNSAVSVSGTLTQGIYGDSEANLWVYYGPKDGGMVAGAWAGSQYVGVNTNFNPKTFSVVLNGLMPNTNYFYRFYAANLATSIWAQASSQFSTVTLTASNYGSQMQIFFSGYNRGETLVNFPVLVDLSTNLPGFSYRQFASASGGDLRFADSSGVTPIPFEIDEWNTNGTSYVWVCVPSLSSASNFIWAYWGNPAATNVPACCTNGAVWPGYDLVWHLQQNGWPYADSTGRYPALTGKAPGQAPGVVDFGGLCDGTSEFLDAGLVPVGEQFSLSAWVNIATTCNSEQTMWCNKQGGWNTAGFDFYVNGWGKNDGIVYFDTADGVNGNVNARTVNNAVSFGSWHFLTGTMDGINGVVHVYVDGVDKTINTGVDTAFQVTNYVRCGTLLTGLPGTTGSGGSYFDGSLDETRIHAGIESSNWVWASWATIASNSVFQNYSAVTQQPPSLTLGVGGGGSSLSWVGSGVGFALYTTTNLASPAAWSPATNQPVFTNNQWQIALPAAANGPRFYRLKSP